MRVYNNVKVHLIFSITIILLTIWLSDMAGLWSHRVSIVMTALSVTLTLVTYYVTRKIPKHDDDIHFHEKDEHAPVRH